jgi:diguanylate cyclase (GGDEF)-like protein
MSTATAPRFRELPSARRALAGAALLAALALLVGESLEDSAQGVDPALLGIVLGLCVGASFLEVLGPGYRSFQPGLTVFFAAAILLPPEAIGVLAVASFVPGRLLRPSRWYRTAFRVAGYALAGTLAHEMAVDTGAFHEGVPAVALMSLVGAVVAFVAVKNGMAIAGMTLLGRRSPTEAARTMTENLSLDLALAATGATLAVVWQAEPAFVVLAVGPLALIYRALWVPALRHKSQTDPKTGLFNSEHFTSMLADAVVQAARHGGNLAVVMLDLDHLRLVNNKCGHLAGDRLIRSVAGVLRDVCPANGLAARFGGEEFSLLLPGCGASAAREIAEEVRVRVGSLSLRQDDAHGELRVTVSAGVAAYPEHGESPTGLLQAADAAVYDAKLGGRNRVRSALPPETRELLALPSEDPLLIPKDLRVTRDVETGIGPPGPPAATVRAAAPASPVARPERGELAAPTAGDGSPADDPARAGQSPTQPRFARLISLYVAVLWLATLTIGLRSPIGDIVDQPALFGLVLASALALDVMRIDIFGRGMISPATVPLLVLAYVFGPLGPIAFEAVVFAIRPVRRQTGHDRARGWVARWTFDFGQLSIAASAAAGAMSLVAFSGDVAVLLACITGGLAYYATNMTLLAGAMSLAEGQRFVDVWRERFSWLWTHYIASAVVAAAVIASQRALGLYVFVIFGLPVLMLWVTQKQYLDRSRANVDQLRRSHQELERANERLRGLLADNEGLLRRMQRSYVSTITSLARTIEAKDPYTGGHTERVAQFAHMLAAELGFDGDELRALDVGSVIHDIGKIGIPDHILLKPGKLDPEELAEMRRHPEISSYIVAELELPPIVKQMVRAHHERYDGTGYPDRLAGEEIPLAARILSVADALDAMTSDRPYRKAMAVDDAVAEIERQAGRQFCPRVVDALRGCLQSHPGLLDALTEEPVGDTVADVA